MVSKYNYSDIITKKDQRIAIDFVDNLIKNECWYKSHPPFQTFADLYKYKEFKIFYSTFLNSCLKYLNINNVSNYKVLMWVFRDNRFNNKQKNQEELWHEHSRGNMNKISGVYYLRNLRNEGTEFKNYKISKPEPYTWYIYPSHLLHKPPIIKSIRNRYVISADLELN